MRRADLVRMANQITDYFEPYPKLEALDGIAKHIHNMWEPRMRNELRAILEGGGEGLKPLCAEALRDYFKGPHSDGRRVTVNPREQAPGGAKPSFADGGGDAG
jgi:formate dehydrogenase subunit delta